MTDTKNTVSDERLDRFIRRASLKGFAFAKEALEIAIALQSLRASIPGGVGAKGVEIEELIEQMLDAQQDINLAANERMDQSLCDASALIDKTETMLRRILATLDLSPAEGEPVATSGSAAEYSRDQLAQLAFAIYYSSNLCAPQNIAAVIEEIDTCGSDCEHVSGSMCRREDQGKFCPFSVAEDLRRLSAALYGPNPPSGYIESVFGPDRMPALYAAPSNPVISDEMVEQAGSTAAQPMVFLLTVDEGVLFDPEGKFHGWIMHRHPDGIWISVRKLEAIDPEDHPLIRALSVNPQSGENE